MSKETIAALDDAMGHIRNTERRIKIGKPVASVQAAIERAIGCILDKRHSDAVRSLHDALRMLDGERAEGGKR